MIGHKWLILLAAAIFVLPASAMVFGVAEENLTGHTLIISGNGTLIGAGSSIYITQSSSKLMSGLPADPLYFGGSINFTVSNYETLVGEWISTAKSTVWVTGIHQAWAETPTPYKTEGNLNMSLAPGSYVLIYGGFPGDRITVTSSIMLLPLNLTSISNLDIPEGTTVNASVSDVTYYFNLTQPGTVIGSFSTEGPFTFGVYSVSSGGFTISSDSGNPYSSGDLNAPLEAGEYRLVFQSAVFHIDSTIQVNNFNPY